METTVHCRLIYMCHGLQPTFTSFPALFVTHLIVTRESSTAKIVLEGVGIEQWFTFLVTRHLNLQTPPASFLIGPTTLGLGNCSNSFYARPRHRVGDPVHVCLVCFLNPLCFLTAFVRLRGKSTTSFSRPSRRSTMRGSISYHETPKEND